MPSTVQDFRAAAANLATSAPAGVKNVFVGYNQYLSSVPAGQRVDTFPEYVNRMLSAVPAPQRAAAQTDATAALNFYNTSPLKTITTELTSGGRHIQNVSAPAAPPGGIMDTIKGFFTGGAGGAIGSIGGFGAGFMAGNALGGGGITGIILGIILGLVGMFVGGSIGNAISSGGSVGDGIEDITRRLKIGGPAQAVTIPAPATGLVQVRRPNPTTGAPENRTSAGADTWAAAPTTGHGAPITITRADGSKITGHVDAAGTNFVVSAVAVSGGVFAPVPEAGAGSIYLAIDATNGNMNVIGGTPAITTTIDTALGRSRTATNAARGPAILAAINSGTNASQAVANLSPALRPIIATAISTTATPVDAGDAKASMLASRIASFYRDGDNRTQNFGAVGSVNTPRSRLIAELIAPGPDRLNPAEANLVADAIAVHHNTITHGLSARVANTPTTTEAIVTPPASGWVVPRTNYESRIQ